MTKDTRARPSAGVCRAGRACADYVQAVLDRKKINRGSDALAEIIDRETGMAELLQAAQWTRDTLRAMVSDHMIEKEVRGLLLVRCNKLEQAIAKCESGTGSE